LRDCILCLGDEVCIYHRENDFYDHVLKIGLPILKVRPVESKQPPAATTSILPLVALGECLSLFYCECFPVAEISKLKLQISNKPQNSN